MLKILIKTGLLVVLSSFDLLGCVTQDENTQETSHSQRPPVVQPQPLSQPIPDIYRRPYAEMISPTTTAAFAHLTGYEGHAIIGNSSVQAIVSGVDPQSTVADWSPFFLAFFHRDNNHGGWIKLNSIFDVSFKRHADKNTGRKQVVAVIPGRIAMYKAAYIDLIYATGPQGNREFLRIYIDQGGNEFFITLDAKTESSAPGPHQRQFSIAINRTRGDVATIPHGLIHYATDDILTVTSSSHINTETRNRTIVISSQGVNSAGWEGYVIGVGPEAGAQFGFAANSRNTCYTKPASSLTQQSTLNQFFGFIRRCQNATLKGEILIRLESETAPWNKALRRFLIRSRNGELLGYTYGLPGTSLRIPLTADRPYIIQEISTGADWGRSTPIVAKAYGAETLSLTGRKPGRLKIDGDPAFPAALMTVRSAVAPDGINFTRDIILNSTGTRMSDSVVLVRTWPVDLDLPPGRYNLEFFREGTANSICTVDVSINDGQVQSFQCKARTETATRHAGSQIDTDTPADEISIRSLKDALAVNQVALASPASANTDGAIQKIRYDDAKTLLVLTAFPVDVELMQVWKSRQRTITTPDRFVAFIREMAPQAIIQLGCPANNLSGREISQWIKRLSPDAIQWYGCRTRSDLQVAFHEVFSQPKPPLILPVSGLKQGTVAAFSPRLTLNSPKQSSISNSLRSGNFTISSGANIQILSIEQQPTGHEWRRITARVKIKTADNAIPLTLKVFTGTKAIHSQSVAPLSETNDYETITFITRSPSFRIAINGSLRNPGNNAIFPGQILASTNYIRVADVKPSGNPKKEAGWRSSLR